MATQHIVFLLAQAGDMLLTLGYAAEAGKRRHA